VTNSREAASAQTKTETVPTPESAAATVTDTGQRIVAQTDLLMRILRASDGKVMLFSHVRTPVYLPINPDGYLEQLRGRGQNWMLALNSFTGGTKAVGQMDSPCTPALRFISAQELLATGCSANGGDRLTALATDGRKLWSAEVPPTEVWPWMAVSADGLRLARETMLLPYEVNANSPIGTADIKGQRVRVYDAADGKVVLTAAASPVLDAGGNVAVSPSGKRVAIIDAGAIQVYELAAPPAVAAPTAKGESAGK
jgi:DNA-binding beta-propeller fold protein YncE